MFGGGAFNARRGVASESNGARKSEFLVFLRPYTFVQKTANIPP